MTTPSLYDKTYRVVFDGDKGRRPKPEPMRCSTPAIALGHARYFGAPTYVVVERHVDTDTEPRVLARLSLRGVDLNTNDWEPVIAAATAQAKQRQR